MRVERVSARPPNNWKKRLKNRNPRILSHATRTRDLRCVFRVMGVFLHFHHHSAR